MNFNNDLLSDTVGAHFAGRVSRLLGDSVSVTECEYDVAADVCMLWTSAATDNIGSSMTSLEAKIRARTRVSSVAIYACKKGVFRIELHGCIGEYKRWSQIQLRIRDTDRLLFFLFGLLASLAGVIFYLCYR